MKKNYLAVLMPSSVILLIAVAASFRIRVGTLGFAIAVAQVVAVCARPEAFLPPSRGLKSLGSPGKKRREDPSYRCGTLAGCGKIELSERFLPSLHRERLFACIIRLVRAPAGAFQGHAQTLRPGLTARKE